MKTTKKPKTLVKTGYIVDIVDGFDVVSSGYGNLKNERLSMAQAIRHFCVECQGGHYFPWQDSDGKMVAKSVPTDVVESCPSTTCWLYANRLGHRAPAGAK